METKKCTRCKKNYPIPHFYSSGGERKSCIKCRNKRLVKNAKRKPKRKTKIKIKFSEEIIKKYNLIENEYDDDEEGVPLIIHF